MAFILPNLKTKKQKFINFYNYTDIVTFSGLINDEKSNVKRKQKTIEKQNKRAEAIASSYRKIFYDLKKVGNKYIFAFESCSPIYETRYNSSGRAYSVIVGYSHTHLSLVTFDEEREHFVGRNFSYRGCSIN